MKTFVGLLFSLGACAGAPANNSAPTHSINTVARAAAESVTRTTSGQSVVISGKALDCFPPEDGQPMRPTPIEALPVKAFDPASNGNLVASLRSLDTLVRSFASDDSAGVSHWNSEYVLLERLFTTATALAIDSTSSTGSYSLTVPSMDSVLVLGFTEVEDEPSYYQYKMLGARSNVSFLLDMSKGGCGPRRQPSGS
jgi:hypothetical protein